MSFNQWKLLNNLKDAVSKITNDKSIQNTFSKDFLQLVQKLPPSLYTNNVIKYFETGTTLTKDETKVDKNEESYVPSVFQDLKNKISTKDPVKANKTAVAKWKPTTIVMEVSMKNDFKIWD